MSYTLKSQGRKYTIDRKEFCDIYTPVRTGLASLDTFIGNRIDDLTDGELEKEMMHIEFTLNKYLELIKKRKEDRKEARVQSDIRREAEAQQLRERAAEMKRIQKQMQIDRFNLGMLKVIPEILVDIIKSYLSTPHRENQLIQLQFNHRLGTDDYQYKDNWVDVPNKYWKKIEEAGFKHTWSVKYQTKATIILTRLAVKDLKHIGNKLLGITIAIKEADKSRVRNKQEWLDAIINTIAEAKHPDRKTMLTILLAGKQLDNQKGKGLVF
jgi:hypothetical protein